MSNVKEIEAFEDILDEINKFYNKQDCEIDLDCTVRALFLYTEYREAFERISNMPLFKELEPHIRQYYT